MCRLTSRNYDKTLEITITQDIESYIIGINSIIFEILIMFDAQRLFANLFLHVFSDEI